MYILEITYYERYEYNYSRVVAVSDSRAKLVEYAATLPEWNSVYDQQWTLKADSSMFIILEQEIETDGSVYSEDAFRISPVQAV